MRSAEFERQTKETRVLISFSVDGSGRAEVKTGVGFLDHMLTLFAVHGFFDLKIEAEGDLHVDAHHTVEDVGICLGLAISRALGDLKGIRRYGFSIIPMEEALARAVVDICNRPHLVFSASFPTEKVGAFDTELVEEFFRAVVVNSCVTLHLNVEYGRNSHHMAEALFKAFARAMDQATGIDSRLEEVLSSKGML
jgi:imidazoleglycerol-phosphate dehydratase